MSQIFEPVRARAISIRWPANLIKPLIASWAIALAAHFAVPLPWTPVPLTGQTLAVAVIALTLRPAEAFQAVCLYLLQGAAGLPVFAGANVGLAAFAGPTGGYLAAMPFAAIAASAISHRHSGSFPLRVIVAWLCSAFILLVGALWLSRYTSSSQVSLWAGVYPFVPGEVAKGLLAAATVTGIRRLRHR